MAAYYTLHIAGLTRELKICPISEKLDIAAFILFSDKGYMTDVLSVQVKSITTAAVQTLYLDGEKAAWMKGKRVLIVDDVISTGDSLRALQQLVKSAGGEIVGNAAPLAEGDAAERKDLIYLEQLPLFFKD